MPSYKEVGKILEVSKKIVGGESTEPYESFERTMNGVYDYLKYVFVNKRENEVEFEKATKELEESCDCEKYKCKKEEMAGVLSENEEVSSGLLTENDEVGLLSENEEVSSGLLKKPRWLD